MNPEQIFLPMCALAFLTFAALTLVPIRRIRAQTAGQVTPADFKLGESARVPPHVAIPNRNYMNLLELPVLFYVLCLALFVTKTVDGTFVTLAWTFVALRFVHSAIHLSYNNVVHRVIPFAVSNFVLLVMWVLFAMAIWPLATASAAG